MRFAQFVFEIRAAALVLACLAGAAQAQTSGGAWRIAPGDSLELLVASAPELKTVSQVDARGDVSFPLVGVVPAAGRDIAEIRAAVQSILSLKLLSAPREDDRRGAASARSIRADEIDVRVASRRPVYVDGDVEQRGPIEFAPGVTVRQVIAAAGGYGNERRVVQDRFVSIEEIEGRRDLLWIDHASASLRLWSLRRELGEIDADQPDMSRYPLDADILAQLLSFEMRRSEARETLKIQNLIRMQSSVDLLRQQLAIQQELLAEETTAYEYDRAELDRLRDLLDRGLTSADRVNATRRALSLALTRRLEVDERIAEVRKELDDAEQTLATFEVQRRASFLEQLVEFRTGLAKTARELEAISARIARKLAYPVIDTYADAQALEAGATITIHRMGGETLANADKDTPLAPGDVVTVRLPALTPTSPRI